MAVIGKYCKAYLLRDLRQYSQWTEQLENIREETENTKRKRKICHILSFTNPHLTMFHIIFN